MHVIATTLAAESRSAGSRHPLLEKVVRAIIPAANPDLEPLYGDVRLWWIEIDQDGTPQRELGFDASGAAIVAGPIGKNMGFWTDSPMRFLSSENELVSSQAFVQAWSSFEMQWGTVHALEPDAWPRSLKFLVSQDGSNLTPATFDRTKGN